MPRWMLLALGALLALTLSACAPAEAPKPAAPRPPQSVVTTPSAEEAKLIGELLTTGSTWDAKARVWRKHEETATFPDAAAARQAFPKLLLPRETLGRRLVGIVHAKAVEPDKMDPWERLTLVYEGEMTVWFTLTGRGEGTDMVRGGGYDPSRETTTIGGVEAEARLLNAPDEMPRGVVRWTVDGVETAVYGPGLTKADAVRVARSLAP